MYYTYALQFHQLHDVYLKTTTITIHVYCYRFLSNDSIQGLFELIVLLRVLFL